LFWRGDYLNGEFKGGEQVDEFVECEFVDVGLECRVTLGPVRWSTAAA
jgi:hypothetical protein